LKIRDIINNIVRPQNALKKTRLKLYNTLTLLTLLYGSKNWTIKKDARRITAAKLKYIRKTAGCIWADYKTKTEIEKTKYNPSFGKIQE
jgi:hypothetical protein